MTCGKLKLKNPKKYLLSSKLVIILQLHVGKKGHEIH